MAKKKKKWIPKNLKKGAFTTYCRQKGFSGVTSECIAMGKKSKSTVVRRRANLASTLRALPRRKKKRGR